MEIWKIERFCETASLEQLRRVRETLERRIAAGELTGKNARLPLQMVEEAIALRIAFGEGEDS